MPGAVSPLIADLVSGPTRTGIVLGVSQPALYLRFDDVSPRTATSTVVPVLRPEALRLPTAWRIGTTEPWPVEPGAAVRCTPEGLHLAGWLVTPARSWSPARVSPVDGVDPLVARERLHPWWQSAEEPDLPGFPGLRVLLYAVCTRLALRDSESVALLTSVFGLGPGLTPSGDDAVCGVLLTLRLLGQDSAAEELARDIHGVLARTTDLSGSLVMAAAQGYAVPQVVDLLHALAAPGRPSDQLPELVSRVLAIGHSSGGDILTGIHATLSAFAGAPAPNALTDTPRTNPPRRAR